jgi:hypothetical protein
MKIETYSFVKQPDKYHYEFFSKGPNGRIRKVVEYSRVQEFRSDVFSLAFGDWDEEKNCIDDQSISNNDDMDKVLATVAATITDFMKAYPEAIIFAEGSTPSRTRLYQMRIAKLLHAINEHFEIKGFINNSWQPFQKGVNYSGFFLKAR